MTNLRVAFFGSPDFAIPTLEALLDSPYRPTVVVTQPERPAGRGRQPQAPPIKPVAEAAGIDVLQPERLREPDAVAAFAAYAPDLSIVVAYGQILPPSVLQLPAHGTLNVHASLLPRWRGASPIQAAILAGDAETGVTIMLVDEGEDRGPTLAKQPEPIRTDDDAGALSGRLERAGATLLLETIPRWLGGEITPTPQDETLVTRARRIKKQQGQIDWTRPAREIERQVRAFSPWPGATTSLRDQPLRIWQAGLGAGDTGQAGKVVAVNKTIDVATGEGLLRVGRLQRAGKRELTAAEFAHGERDLLGAVLGLSDD